MNELQVFSNPEFGQVRSLMIDDAPWVVGRDAATALGYADTVNALKAHVDAEDKRVLKGGELPPLEQQRSENTTFAVPNRGMTIINESGLYSLIFSSKLPSAKRFKRWVTSEVLPALRRTGRYELPQTDVPLEFTNQQSMCIRAASIIATCRNGRLPMVLSCLRQAGIDVEDLAGYTNGSRADYVSVRELLHKAKQEYGITPAQAARELDLQESTLYYYNTGRRNPRRDRAEQIALAVDRLIQAVE